MTSASEATAWTCGGFEIPESPLYDAQRQLVYVSNMVTSEIPTPQRAESYISKVSPEGEVIERRWIGGVHQAKNIALRDHLLFIADSRRLVVADVESGDLVDEYAAPDAFYIDGVAVHETGDVYVTDLAANTIWRLTAAGEWGPWVHSDLLAHPDGIVCESDRIVSAGFGALGPFGDTTDGPRMGHVSVTSLADGSVSALGSSEPLGHLDGLSPDGAGGYFTTDSINGVLWGISQNGERSRVLNRDPASGPADLDFAADLRLLLVAELWTGNIVALDLDILDQLGSPSL